MTVYELLTDLTIHYNALIRKSASALNLTSSQAFHLISIPYDGITMSALSDKLGLDNSTLSRNIQKLERLGLIKRGGELYDRRVQKIFLTNRGNDIVEKIEVKLGDVNHSMIESLDIDTQERLLDILERLVWSIDCMRGQ
jgi:DNA-binding MarR family transcriptional regulator